MKDNSTVKLLPTRLQQLIERNDKLKKDLIAFVNAPRGKKTVTLSTGEKALDADDAWLVIGRSDGQPIIRDKRDQRIYDRLPTEMKPSGFNDTQLLSSWETGDIIRLLNSLNENGKLTN